MPTPWAALSAGMLAGAAGATAHNAVTYLDQAVRGDAATSSPAGGAPDDAAETVGRAIVGDEIDRTRAAGLGPLGGLAIGIGVGAVAGLVRGATVTPPAPIAALLTGIAAMAVGDGIALATGSAEEGWDKPATLLRNLVPHVVYGAITGAALHRMLDPHTTHASR